MFGYLVSFHWFAIINMNISVYTFMLHSILRIRINGSKNISLVFFQAHIGLFFWIVYIYLFLLDRNALPHTYLYWVLLTFFLEF